jgi:hypothetical protein
LPGLPETDQSPLIFAGSTDGMGIARSKDTALKTRQGGTGMNRVSVCWVAVTAALLLASGTLAPAAAGGQSYRMAGEITAIDIGFQTVVIEVPLGDKYFTVGGPLGADAVLVKGGRPVTLEDFQTGDPVSVVWRATPSGHLIERLESR